MNRKDHQEDAVYLKDFVRHTLGCTCPDDVFNQIEHILVPCDPEEPSNVNKIIIGKRLLIMIWRIVDPVDVENGLPVLIRSGKTERDRRQLNRLRLVCAVDDVNAMRTTAENAFNRLHIDDEKIHIHVVHQNDLPESW